jgi:ADP-ribose pyrophosphatase
LKKKKLFRGKNFDVSSYEFSISGKKVQHEIIEQNSVSAILAIEDNKIIMVKQFRYPHKEALEIPAGIINKNETSLNCAKRELLEETGYSAINLKYLTRYYPVQGYNLQYVDCFVATKLKKTSELKLDDGEFVTVVKVPLKKIISMIKSGKITDSKTICSVMIYASKKNML